MIFCVAASTKSLPFTKLILVASPTVTASVSSSTLALNVASVGAITLNVATSLSVISAPEKLPSNVTSSSSVTVTVFTFAIASSAVSVWLSLS